MNEMRCQAVCHVGANVSPLWQCPLAWTDNGQHNANNNTTARDVLQSKQTQTKLYTGLSQSPCHISQHQAWHCDKIYPGHAANEESV